MVVRLLHRVGVRRTHLHLSSLAAIALCVSLWVRAKTVDQVERLRFLEREAGSMVAAAARYPLSFPEVSTVILGTKTVAQAESNFGQVPGGVLSPESLERIARLQVEMGLRGPLWRRALRKFGIGS